MSAVEPREKRLAEAVALLMDAIYHDVPAASMRPLPPYDDEDFTLEIRIPAGTDRDTVLDRCIHHALTIEAQFGFVILTRVRMAQEPVMPT